MTITAFVPSLISSTLIVKLGSRTTGGITLAVTLKATLASPAVKFSLASDVILTVFKPTVRLPAGIVKVPLPALTATLPTSTSPTKTLTLPVKLPRA